MNAKALAWCATAAALLVGFASCGAQASEAIHDPLVTSPNNLPVFWSRKPNGKDLQKIYPPRAMRERRSGAVELKCSVTHEGDLADCVALDDQPSGYGFGEAGVALSPYFKLKTKPGAVLELAGAMIYVPIRFNAGGGVPPLSINDGRRALLATPSSGGSSAKKLFKCSIAGPDSLCQGHEVDMVQAMSTAEAASILVKANLNAGKSVVACEVIVGGALTSCKLGGNGAKADAAAAEWASRLRVAPKAKDGTPTTGAHLLLEINWGAVR